MATQHRITGWPACALLALAALLAAGARADDVTTAECKARGVRERVRLYPTDSDATRFYMYRCKLTQIDPSAFTDLPNLESIYLHDNDIENINPVAFHTVPVLTMLWLQRNKLRELPVFDERSCANLTDLYLDSNKLTVIDDARTFSACSKLKRLDLDYNGIEFFHPNVFSALIDLRTLFLNYNKIRFIPDRMFGSNRKLELLYLNNNLITHLPPDFASSLRRASGGLNNFYFDDNPWHCSCLLELLADVQRASRISHKLLDSTHYNGAQPECNFIGMYPCRRDAPSVLLRLRAPTSLTFKL